MMSTARELPYNKPTENVDKKVRKGDIVAQGQITADNMCALYLHSNYFYFWPSKKPEIIQNLCAKLKIIKTNCLMVIFAVMIRERSQTQS